ncbi:MAG: DUF368 domain-containing protein [Thermotogaceae bacterium]|nr:DUF368 domain-containing protein [Thermotogaceae bacterium]
MKDIVLGFVMGIANLLPGISGGTIMFISGKYESIVDAVWELITLKIKKEDFWFLMRIALGVVAAFLGLSKLIDYLFIHFPVQTVSFFAGLIIGGLFYLYREISFNFKASLSIAAGALLMVLIMLANGGNFPPNYFNLFIGGAVAGATMILPGISGSSMLVLLGLYDDAIHAVSNMEILKLILLGAGAAAGIALITYLMSFLMRKFKNETISFLYGLTVVGLIFIVKDGVSISFILFGLGSYFALGKIIS